MLADWLVWLFYVFLISARSMTCCKSGTLAFKKLLSYVECLKRALVPFIRSYPERAKYAIHHHHRIAFVVYRKREKMVASFAHFFFGLCERVRIAFYHSFSLALFSSSWIFFFVRLFFFIILLKIKIEKHLLSRKFLSKAPYIWMSEIEREQEKEMKKTETTNRMNGSQTAMHRPIYK